MNTTTHTPGPWKLYLCTYPNGKLSGRPYVYAPAGPDEHRHVCEPFIDERATPEVQAMQEANARLIAAAPLMHDLLEMIARSACLDQLKGDQCICLSCKAKDLIASIATTK